MWFSCQLLSFDWYILVDINVVVLGLVWCDVFLGIYTNLFLVVFFYMFVWGNLMYIILCPSQVRFLTKIYHPNIDKVGYQTFLPELYLITCISFLMDLHCSLVEYASTSSRTNGVQLFKYALFFWGNLFWLPLHFRPSSFVVVDVCVCYSTLKLKWWVSSSW
jgi:hypothetical protein